MTLCKGTYPGIAKGDFLPLLRPRHARTPANFVRQDCKVSSAPSNDLVIMDSRPTAKKELISQRSSYLGQVLFLNSELVFCTGQLSFPLASTRF